MKDINNDFNLFVCLEIQISNICFDENHETGQIQAKGPSGEGRRLKWRRTKPPSGEG